MVVLIDAFNLIYKFPDLELCMYEDRLDEAKEGLYALLKEARSKSKDLEYAVFVDGKKIKGDYETLQEEKEGLKIFYSQEKEADDLIRVYIKEHPNPSHLSLVTSDKKIIQFAKQFKVKCIRSEVYSESIKDLLKDASPDNPSDDKPKESNWEEWMEVFTKNQSQTK